MNDMSYSGMFFSMLKKDKNRLDYEMELENQGVLQKTSYLNETDPIWRNLRY